MKKPGKPRIDLKDTIIGEWTVLHYIGGGASPKWMCRCTCGTVKPVLGHNLRIKRSTNCGCIKNANISKSRTRHGHSAGGKTSITYQSWRSMMARCFNVTDPNYHQYGGRGITVYAPWAESFESFLADVGLRPSSKYTIDRYPDGRGSYMPGNVRWATATEQGNNRPDGNRFITAFGRTQTLADWAREMKIKWHTLKERLNNPTWSVERALTEPVATKFHPVKSPPASATE